MSKPTPKYDTIDVTQFEYTEPRRNPSGGFNTYVNGLDGKSPLFQLPECEAIFGVSDPLGESTRRNMEVKVSDKKVIEFFNTLDAQNIRVAAEKSKTFFKKELSEEILSMTLHRKSLKFDEEKKYDPLLRLKCVPSGKKQTVVYVVTRNANGEEEYSPGTLDQITRRSMVVPIVEISGMWYTSTQFGMTYLAKALMVWPAAQENEIQFSGLSVKKRRLNPSAGDEGAGSGSAEITKQVEVTVKAEDTTSPFSEEIM